MNALLHANVKGADQPAHMRSLISTFVARFVSRNSLSLFLNANFEDFG